MDSNWRGKRALFDRWGDARAAYAADLMRWVRSVPDLHPTAEVQMIDKIGMPAANALDRIAETAFGARARKTDAAAGGGGDFASLIQQSLAQVNAAQGQAETTTHKYQLGQDGVSLEDAMISMQKANIGFQTTVQVRNKLVSAYNDIMNMQL